MNIADFIRRLFRIHRGEELKVFQFITLGTFLQAGIAIGMSLTDTLFLIEVGPDKLPIIYMIVPIIMTLFTPVYSYFLNRFGVQRSFGYILFILLGGGIFFYLLVSSTALLPNRTLVSLVFYMAKLYSFLWMIALYTLYWSFVEIYFDILDAKRLYPLFSGGLALGAVVGGSMVSVFTTFLNAEFLFLVWSVLAAATYPLLLLLKRRWRPLELFEAAEESSLMEQTGDVLKAMKSSRYVLLLNLTMFGTIFLTTVCEFQYMEVFSEMGNTEQLAALFGKLFAAANVFNLVINFIVFTRLITYLGVRNLVLVQPLIYLAAFIFYYFDYGFNAALFGFLAYQGAQLSIDSNNWNFIYNAAPSESKTQVRTFVENLGDPLATAAAGVFLAVWAPALDPRQIAQIAILVGVGHIIVSLLLRNDYLMAMITNLRHDWLDFSQTDEEIIRQLSVSDLDILEEYALHSQLEVAKTAVRFLWILDNYRGLRALLALFDQCSENDRQKLTELFEMMLRDEDNMIVREILLWLETQDVTLSPSLTETLGSHGMIQAKTMMPLLRSHDPVEMGAAAISLLNSWDIQDGFEAIWVVNQLAEGGDDYKKIAIRVLGRSKQERYAHYLVQFLDHPDRSLRLETLRSLNELVSPDSTRLIPAILTAIEKGNHEERILGLDVLLKIKDSGCVAPLIKISETFTPFQRRRTEQIILSIGLQTVPMIVSIFRDSKLTTKARSIAARALSKLAFPQFENYFGEIIARALPWAYIFLAYHLTLKRETESAGIGVLAKLYHSVYTQIIEFVLEILAIGGRLPDFEMISSSLRSTNPKIRANTIETIEQGVSRDIFVLLLPLVDSRSPEDKIEFYKRKFSRTLISAPEIIKRALDSKFAIECAAGAQALWESSREDALDILHDKMREVDMPLVQETIISLLSKRSFIADLNIVEKLYYLSHSRFFDDFGISEMKVIAESAVEVHFQQETAIYRQGDADPYLYYVIIGDVMLRSERGEMRRSAGDVFGECCLFGYHRREQTAITSYANVLTIAKEDIFNFAEAYPKIATELLKNRVHHD